MKRYSMTLHHWHAMKFRRFAALLQDHDSKNQCPRVWGQSSLAKYLYRAALKRWNAWFHLLIQFQCFVSFVSTPRPATLVGSASVFRSKQNRRFRVVSEFPCFWWGDRRDFWRANRPVLCFSPQRLMEMKTINIINIHMHSYFTTTNLKWIFPTPEWNWGPCRTRSNGRCSHKGRTTWPVEIWRAMTCLIMHLESSHATNNVQTSYNVQRLPGRMLPQRESSTPRKWQIAPCAKSDVQHSWGSALE